MRLPRDLSGNELAKHLGKLGYVITRQTGSHMRLTTEQNGRHSITIPAHSALRVGTVSAILSEVAKHHDMTRDDLLHLLFSDKP